MRSVLLLTCMALFLEVSAQINYSNYFQSRYLPTVDVEEYRDVVFQWNFEGKLQTLVNSGITELSEKNYPRAIAILSDAIEKEPSLWVSYYYRGICHKILRNWDEAIQDFKISNTRSGNHPEILIELGEIYQIRGELELAQKQYEKAKNIAPQDVESFYGLGNISFLKMEKNKAARFYSRCVEINPHYANAYVRLALLKLSDDRKAAEAFPLFEKALGANPRCQEALFWRALLYAELNQPEKSIADWDILIQTNPGNTFFVLLRGFLYIELKNFDKAFIDLKNALLHSEVDENNFSFGQTVLNKRIDLQSAAAYLMRNVFGLDDAAANSLKIGFCRILANDYSPAINDLRTSIGHQPSASAYWLKALAHEYLHQHDSAHASYDKTLILDNDLFDAHKKRAIYRFDRKEWKGAYIDFMHMERLQPESIITYRLRGLLKHSQKDFYGAIVDLTKYLKTDSTNTEILKIRAQAEVEVHSYKLARSDYEKLIVLEPNDNFHYEQLYHIHLLLEDTVRAFEELEKYNQKFAIQSFAHLRKMELYIAQKKWDQALTAFEGYKKIPFYESVMGSYPCYLVGLILSRQNRDEEALAMLSRSIEKGIQRDSLVLDALYERGKIYLKIGKTKKGINDFKELKAQGYEGNEEFINSVLKGAIK
jgi:tetratricopeptide (TPR) repeat protein